MKEIFGECRSFDTYGYQTDDQGWPLITDCNKVAFFKYYTTSQSLAIFDALYTNKQGLTDKFVAYWDVVAAKFANNPYVIGFDPINEPFPADFMTDPNILKPGVFDKEKLAPLYAKVFEKYMKYNKNQIMYFETGQFPDSYLGKVLNAGFESPPGGKNGSANHVLNDHSYCCQLGPTICATGEPAADKGPECSQWHHDRIATRAQDAKDLGIPLIVSEFGACFDSDECAREISQVADECDKVLAGWAYWEFKNYKDLTTTAGTGSEGFYNNDGSL